MARLISISLLLFASLIAFTPPAMAQKPSGAQLKSALTFCLFHKFPGVKESFVDSGQSTAFDPKSGRNFAWDSDKQGWIDTKTGENVCGGSPAKLKSTLTFCLFYKFPAVKESFVDSGQSTAFDPKSGRNFAWDKDKQAWIDTKTLECVCPVCEAATPRPAGEPKPKLKPKQKSEPKQPKTEQKPEPPQPGGALDPCLVGTWRSESIVNVMGMRGGSGILMTIKPDGRITIDYNEMQSLEAEVGNVGEHNWWKGTAEGKLATGNGVATIVSVEKSDVSRKSTDPHGKTVTNAIGNLGPAAPGSFPPDNSYTCDGTTLTRKGSTQTFNFKRQERSP